MSSATAEAYGRWKSSLTASDICSDSVILEEVEVDPDTRTVYLLEGRPSENGRRVITTLNPKTKQWQDMSLVEHDCRTKVHEYGGGAFTIDAHQRAIYNDSNSNGVYSITCTAEAGPASARQILQGRPDTRYGDFCVHPTLGRYILAVQEVHGSGGPAAVTNNLVVVDAQAKTATALVEGADFYAYPRWSPDGRHVCWTQWSAPDMPWTGSQLYVGQVEWSSSPSPTEGTVNLKLINNIHVAGKHGRESVGQPQWHPDGRLFYVDDRSGWWQMYSVDLTDVGPERPASPKWLRLKGLEEVEFGIRDIYLGSSSYALLGPRQLVAVVTSDATSNVVLIDLDDESWEDLQLGIVEVPNKSLKRLSATEFIIIGTTTTTPTGAYLVTIDDLPSTPARATLIKSSVASGSVLDPADLSLPELISFPRLKATGERRSTLCHGIFYPPKNSSYTGLPGTRPPLIVLMHSGPSSHSSPAFALETQYWTTRGYGYVAVNYLGSTGFGRAYREALNGHWGVVDGMDAKSCVQHLAERDQIDARRVGIVGGSAGGYSVLQALCTYPGVWRGGVSLYGLGNLQLLEDMMHKYERHYVAQLVLGAVAANPAGLYTSGQDKESVYRARSPCYHADKITAPLLLMQGSADSVVPPSQATEMVTAVRLRPGGGEVDLKIFEGEGHGWVRKDTMETALQLETAWWEKTLLG